jgi:hypothetical protein
MVFNHIRENGEIDFITEDAIAEARGKYDELCEDFLDVVFEAESRLEKKEWQRAVVDQASWVFEPEKIRQKLYGDYLKKN